MGDAIRTWVIIPSSNGMRWLPDCLGSLVPSLPVDATAFVVDNASTDGSAEFVSREFPMVKLLRSAPNLGFVDATNLGIERALDTGAENVVLLNNDVRLGPDWFRRLMEVAERHPGYGILGPRQVDFTGVPSPRTAAILNSWRGAGPEGATLPEVIDTDWVEGSCLFVRASVLDRVGLLDRLFAPAYFEELDFCRTARRAGIRVGLAGNVRIAHHGAGSSTDPDTARRRRRLMERNYLLYHATDSEVGFLRRWFGLASRAVRHGMKSLIAGRLTLFDWLSALVGVARCIPAIEAKVRRDRMVHPRAPAIDPITPAPGECLSTPPRVSVVIPVRNRFDELARCLRHVTGQHLPHGTFEVLVCDDGTPEPAARELRRLCERWPAVRYLRQAPAGPAAARNLGIANARAEVVAFTDSDTEPTARWLERLLEPFEEGPVIAVEGPVRPPDEADSPLQDAPRNEGGVHLTANIAYRRSVLLVVGGFDDSFPMPAYEDVDLALRLRSKGRFAWAPDAIVHHRWCTVRFTGALQRLRQFDWLLVTALRHGCLGWEDRPTRFPRLRIALAATVTLPLGRIRSAAKFLRRRPLETVLRIAMSLSEGAIALALVPRWLTARGLARRHGSLDGAVR